MKGNFTFRTDESGTIMYKDRFKFSKVDCHKESWHVLMVHNTTEGIFNL